MLKGRPTKKQEKQIKEKIISLYAYGLSAKAIINITKFNKDTVYKHLKNYVSSNKKDDEFDKKLSVIVNHTLIAFDNRLYKALEFEKELEQKSKKENNPEYLLEKRIKFQKLILDLLDKKSSYAIQVVADEFEGSI